MFAFQDTRGLVDVAFTDRHGGVSPAPYTSLNLAEVTNDDLSAIEENFRRATAAFTGASTPAITGAQGDAPGPGHGATLARMHQVHSAEVAVVAEPGSPDGVAAGSAHVPRVDGLVTRAPGVVLVVRAADCVPLLLADASTGVVGAAHAGRPGLVAGIVPATVARMRDLGAEEIVGWVGPHVCGSCYEVPDAMRAEAAEVVPESYAETSWGTPAIDIGAGVRAQLATAGVEVVEAARCTREDEDLYSYRRQGDDAGRLAGLVWVRP